MKRKRACLTMEEALKCAKAKLNENQKQLKAAKMRLARARQREEATSVSIFLKSVLLLLYFFNNYNANLSIQYWQAVRKRKSLSALSNERCRRVVEDLFMGISEDNLLHLADADVTSQPFALQTAKHFEAKRRLKDWVSKLNIEKGLAPSSRMVAQRYNVLREDVPFVLRAGSQVGPIGDPAVDVAARVKLHRWRREQQLRYGAVRVLDYIPLQEKRDKAVKKMFF